MVLVIPGAIAIAVFLSFMEFSRCVFDVTDKTELIGSYWGIRNCMEKSANGFSNGSFDAARFAAVG